MGTTILGQYVNQLAQSFTVSEQYGVYVTKIGLFFQSKNILLNNYKNQMKLTVKKKLGFPVVNAYTSKGILTALQNDTKCIS